MQGWGKKGGEERRVVLVRSGGGEGVERRVESSRGGWARGDDGGRHG